MIHHKATAGMAVSYLLQKMQPDWQPGADLKPEVVEVLQALELKPYVGWERTGTGTRVSDGRWETRMATIEQNIKKVPKYDIEGAKFS